MRTLLIVFAILLLLLTLLGAFGGSIKYNEPFLELPKMGSIKYNELPKKSKFMENLSGEGLSHFTEDASISKMGMDMNVASETLQLNIPTIPPQISQFMNDLPPNMTKPVTSDFSNHDSMNNDSLHQMDESNESKNKSLFSQDFNIEPFEHSEYTSQPANF
jgi:hypothetical protein